LKAENDVTKADKGTPLAQIASPRVLRDAYHKPASSTLVLAIILGSQLMLILDSSVVITALPKIHFALGFSAAGLSWVQNGYTLAFGGLLLLGARAGDVFGRRRVFMAGIALFTVASLFGGLAQSASWLLVARALQGSAAAVAAPATLALLAARFKEGRQRTRAVALYSGVSGGGGSVGLVVGGMLTSWVSWRWVLFINVPIGVAVLVLAPRALAETPRSPGRFDLPGALTSTVGMEALVYGIVRAGTAGWSDPITIAWLIGGVVLVGAFVFIELLAEQPITPLRLFASRERTGAYLGRGLVFGGLFSIFFFITQFLQGVYGYSPLRAGLAFLPMTLVMFAMVHIVPSLAPKLGMPRLLIGSLATALAGAVWMSRISKGTHYFPQVAVPLVLLGIGVGTTTIPLTSSGIARVLPQDAGAASGVVTTAQQVGGSLCLGVLVTVFTAASASAARHLPVGTTAQLAAKTELAHGTAMAVTGSAVLLALALVIVAVVIARSPAPAGAGASAPR
jgi:EmrB/QacA subfamily drug resistance transporter